MVRRGIWVSDRLLPQYARKNPPQRDAGADGSAEDRSGAWRDIARRAGRTSDHDPRFIGTALLARLWAFILSDPGGTGASTRADRKRRSLAPDRLVLLEG